MSEVIRVLLADNHPLRQVGMRTILAAQKDLKLVGEASDANEVKQRVRELQPNVLLLAQDIPGPPLVETVAYLCQHESEIKVLVLAANENCTPNLLLAGVTGCLLRDEAVEVMTRAIRSVAQGDLWFSRTIVHKLVQWRTDTLDHSGEPSLTNRERQILNLMGRGWDNAQIATKLCLAEQTVRNYISRIYTKLPATSRAEAVVWSREHGLLRE